ncbi:glycerol-3-phosphate dehydrogenase [NAD(P)+] 2 [Planctomycetota bacterium]|nr:glycerol-3-phosphate dehydrogenase [NAD(P)+] 2 [Planctomycetota bacterium]
MRTVIIGTGAWGVAFARILAGDARGPVVLLGRDPGKCAVLSKELPNALITTDPAALAMADLVLWAVPCQFTRAVARSLAGVIPTGAAVVSLAKGLERGSLERPSVMLASELGCPVGALSGPSLAAEVAAGSPVALVCAGPPQVRQAVVERVHGGRIRIYSSTDLVGVELAGALKNIVAIAAGMCDGLGLGDNAKAALVTRGLAEMRRLGRALGADDATFAGLAGMGDLVATCWSRLSRNRALGEAVARGSRPVDLLSPGGTIAEGAWTAAAALALAERQAAELPIASQVESVLWHDRPVPSALDALLARAPKDENA